MNNREKIGFTLPHLESPISKFAEKGISPSEYLSRRAIEKEKDIYLKKPGGEDEFNREISEKYVTAYPDYEIKNIPTDDGEVQDEVFKSNIKPYQLGYNYRTDNLERSFSNYPLINLLILFRLELSFYHILNHFFYVKSWIF